ncbi:rubredoxin [Halopseudomonas pelagia]|uniref:Rubredoxin n=1 Tax=Halopseudomonas pelagia TaxID=553151 RepID=A0AA91U1T1_9GAMM|nr:rubredoxin [Halopseudomonas pelagia]QFY54965.1 rubredoxin [Halopseudomonas pelagia]
MAKYQCPDCGYVYAEVVGDPREGFPAGTTWGKIPEDWSCPDCAVRDKVDFVAVQEANSELSVSSTNTAVRLASQVKTEGGSQKETDRSTPSAKHKTKPKSKPKPTSLKWSKDSTQKNTYRKWVCITCGHIYDEYLGDEAEGFPPGTRFEDIPDDWCCPDCGATKEDYVLYED